MDRFVVREPRTSAEYPQGNQMMAFPANAVGSNIIPPETMYFSGPFTAEYSNAPNNMSAQYSMNPQHNINAQQNIHAQHNMNAQRNANAQFNINAINSMNAQYNTNAQQSMNAQHNVNAQLNMASRNISAQNVGMVQNMGIQRNTGAQNATQHNLNNQLIMSFNSQIAQNFGQKSMPGQGPMPSGIDPRYLAGYNDNSAQFIVPGQQIQRNATPITRSFGSDYQNRTFNAIDRNKQKSFAPHTNTERARVDAMPMPVPLVTRNQESAQKNYSGPQPKKPNELDLPRNDIQNQIVTRADKLKALNKSGPRAFSGPVEKVLKWHKSLQDIGVLILYEVVATCISVRSGESLSKILLVRDESGPAMQVIYYEVDFLLPELRPPCTVRVVGRMMAGTCRLQAFRVRPATGDDVSTLPRRAAVAAHHVAKLCKEYGNNTNP